MVGFSELVGQIVDVSGVPGVYALRTTDSTNRVALALADMGAPDGTVVVADAQAAGRGRLGRTWYSPAGAGLYLSQIRRLDWPAARAPRVTLAVAVAAAQALEDLGLSPGVEWPNDILLGERKVAGVLTELRTAGDRVDAIVVGLGVNVERLPADAPTDVRERAASVTEAMAAAGLAPVGRAAVAGALLRRLQDAFVGLRATGTIDPAAWASRSVTLGRRVRVLDPAGAWEGRALDLREDGVLLVERDGAPFPVVAGEVTHLGDVEG